MIGWLPSMDEVILFKALGLYKERYGYSHNKDIDLDKLDEIIKEIKDDSKAAKRKSTKRSRRSNK
jgi:hypothetical protein